MAYNEFLADRIRNQLSQVLHVEERKMMGGLIFMVNHKMCLGVDIDMKSLQDRLMVRVGKLPYKDLLHVKGSKEMNFTGTAMRGFLFIDPEGIDSEQDLEFWITKALEFNKRIV